MIASALLLPLLLALRVRAVSAGLETLLFDAPAARAPDGSLAVSASVFTYRADARAGELESALARLVRPLTLLGVPHDAALATARARLRLFAAEPAADETVALAVAGCAGAPAPLGPTDATGVAVQTVALGACAAADVDAPLAGTVAGANASVPMAVYPAPDGGFGVISDIDDTIKISHVLHKLHLLKTTLFDAPGAVPGMPALYANLSASLNHPPFAFVTGSPFQLVQFLRGFLRTTYAAAPGPILARNLTLTDTGELDRFLFDVNSTETFKLTQIARIHALWPNKAFLTIGDSGERDPETYGVAYRMYGPSFVRCIWIRRLPDPAANNTDARFAAAFGGIPPEKVRVYTDADILTVLPTIDVAGGAC